jgi:predicted enzyme involved in methoxymalonyl-ACP biosynthesis
MLDCCLCENDLNEQVDAFTAACIAVGARAIFVPTWVISAFHQTHGLLDLSSGTGVARALMRINMRLIESLENIPTAHALWAEKWVQLGGSTAFNERLWYLGKIPFSNEVFKAAARDLKAALRGLRAG